MRVRQECECRPPTLIRPTLPEKYSSQADYRAFQKYLMHGTAYVKYSYMEKQQQVMVLSEFLAGKALLGVAHSSQMDPEGVLY